MLPTRLNFDAVVFRGCTMKEMQIIAISNLIVNLLLYGFLMKLLINMFLIGVGISFVITVGTSYLTASILQKAKQGKPKGYVKKKYILWCEDRGFIKSPYIRRSGKWSCLGRRI